MKFSRDLEWSEGKDRFLSLRKSSDETRGDIVRNVKYRGGTDICHGGDSNNNHKKKIDILLILNNVQ